MNIPVKIKKLHPDAVIPQRATDFAGGWDVVVTEIKKESEDFIICKLGFTLEVPVGYKVTIVPRSSLTKTRWIMQNAPGLGDCDYRGEYQIRFRAIPEEIGSFGEGESHLLYPSIPFCKGDRVGQIYLEEVINITFEEVEELSDTNRGEGGFGSSGK